MTLTKSEQSARRTAWNLRHIVSDLICDAFTLGDYRFKPDRALRVQFRLDHDSAIDNQWESLSLWLWAPMNYVGVFRSEPAKPVAFKDDVPTVLLCYHDSCWRSDGVERFTIEWQDRMAGLALDRMRVEPASEQLQQTFRGLIRDRDNAWKNRKETQEQDSKP